MGIGILEAVQEEEGGCVEDVHKSLVHLREKMKRQAKITLAWKTKFRDENRLVTKLRKQKDDYLQTIQSQLLIFESHLLKSRKELDNVVTHKDAIIRRQHHLICSLTLALIKREGHEDLKKILPGLKLKRSPSELSKNTIYETMSTAPCSNDDLINEELGKEKKHSSSKNDFESLNDSDSAIMMEDAYDSLIALPVGKGEVKVMRSVSDALEIISRGVSSSLTNNNNNNNNNNNKSNLSNQVRRPPHGSLSSTPSCSSSESDDSPTSTITKSRNDHLNKEKLSNGILRLNQLSTNLPLTSSTPNNYPPSIHSSNVWQVSPFACSKTNDSCDAGLCTSPCFECDSSSTTPLVSPSETPSISPHTTPPTSPRLDDASTGQTKYDFDSDATLSDGQSDDGESDLGQIGSHSYDIHSTDKTSRFGSYDQLNDYDVSYLKKIRTPKSETIQVTYNRVMSNHRSVTKPKDVKYKRINKAKSRSLEELRGKLKLYDGKQSYSVDLGQSDA